MPARTLLQPLTVEGTVIPAKSSVMVDFYQLHHNPDVWGDDHMDYRPERFCRDQVADRDPLAFLPFSIGPHNCIGQQLAMQELQIVAADVLHRFSFGLIKESQTVFAIVGKPEGEVLLEIKRR